MLDLIPKLITAEQNKEIGRIPSKEEVKEVVRALNAESASRPDGFSGLFFQSCWDIIGEVVILSFVDNNYPGI